MAMALRPVVTPGNNPEGFRQRVAALKANAFPKAALEPQQVLKHVPGCKVLHSLQLNSANLLQW